MWPYYSWIPACSELTGWNIWKEEDIYTLCSCPFALFVASLSFSSHPPSLTLLFLHSLPHTHSLSHLCLISLFCIPCNVCMPVVCSDMATKQHGSGGNSCSYHATCQHHLPALCLSLCFLTTLHTYYYACAVLCCVCQIITLVGGQLRGWDRSPPCCLLPVPVPACCMTAAEKPPPQCVGLPACPTLPAAHGTQADFSLGTSPIFCKHCTAHLPHTAHLCRDNIQQQLPCDALPLVPCAALLCHFHLKTYICIHSFLTFSSLTPFPQISSMLVR